MTRINTNVSSLVAQNRLQTSNNDLQQSLTRLSTGLRINSGSDDPAGLLASEALRSEITGLTKSISNTQRASQIISTADSALGQVSNLLNDIRGLVVEAGNSGALSDDEIAANQLQIDSSLEAINRIAQTTTFQGRKLLDGSQDFVSTIGSVSSVKDISIDQANLGRTGNIDVEVVIGAAATQAEVTAADTGFTTAAQATVDSGVTFGESTLTINTSELIKVTGEGLTSVSIVDDSSVDNNTGSASFDAETGVLTVTANFTGVAAAGPPEVFAADADATAILAAINDLDGFTAVTAKPADAAVVAGTPAASTASAVTDLGEGLTITATAAGADYNNVKVKFVSGTSNEADFDSTLKVLTVTFDGSGPVTGDDLKTAIEAATVDGDAPDDPIFEVTTLDDTEFANLATQEELDTLLTGGEALSADVVFQLNGSSGAETFNFGAGTSKKQVAAAINLVQDSTGVSASTTGALTFTSTDYGSSALANVEVISEGTGGTFKASIATTRSTGTNVQASINGVKANTSGNTLSINTATLDLSLTVEAGSNANFNFSITGGGSTFQLGPEVTSTQQATLGISSVSTGKLGGVSGRLYELGSGQAKSLANDVNGAAKIIDEVIAKVAQTRGRLGSFQSTTLESNLVSLNETKANLQEAESSIRDADFAQESAKLTRAQILVQSGTNVLALANQNPQNVLALLR